jgi:hypothetical protein
VPFKIYFTWPTQYWRSDTFLTTFSLYLNICSYVTSPVVLDLTVIPCPWFSSLNIYCKYLVERHMSIAGSVCVPTRVYCQQAEWLIRCIMRDWHADGLNEDDEKCSVSCSYRLHRVRYILLPCRDVCTVHYQHRCWCLKPGMSASA